MESEITKALRDFSRSFKKFSSSSKNDCIPQKKSSSKDSLLQEEINLKEEKFRSGIIATYRIYKNPFEALGQESDRAAAINNDEQLLFKAYELYRKVMELNRENPEETGDTFIQNFTIFSPLSQKAAYTEGGQFIYLCLWLYFEKKCQEYIPFFETFQEKKKKKKRLSFTEKDSYSCSFHDKEIFEIVRQEFYS